MIEGTWAYKLRKYATKHNREGDPSGHGYAIGVPADVGRTFPEGQRFEFRQGPGDSLIFEPIKENTDA